MLPAAVARSFSDDDAVRYVLPVLWLTSLFSHNRASWYRHRVTTCHRSWRHRRLETERWPPLKSINRNTTWLVVEHCRRDIQSSLWLVKQLLIGWLIDIPPFFGFQFGRLSWPRPLLVFDWQVMNLEYLIQICGYRARLTNKGCSAESGRASVLQLYPSLRYLPLTDIPRP